VRSLITRHILGGACANTFGIVGGPGLVYDSVEVGVQESGVTSKRHYIVLALAISGSTAATPQTMKVDYVRVWKRERKSGV
jgi:hypothetical protein